MLAEVDYVEVKLTCNGRSYLIKFKAGQLSQDPDQDSGHPGVCTLVFSKVLRDQLIGAEVITDITEVQTIESLEARFDRIILGVQQFPKGKHSSGDCFCFEDDRGNWVCVS